MKQLSATLLWSLGIVTVAFAFYKFQPTSVFKPGIRNPQQDDTSNPSVNASAGYKGANETNKNDILSFSIGLDNDRYWVDSANKTAWLYIETKAGFYQNKNEKRIPLNLSIVIDRSGSMHGDKINFVKQSAKFAIDNLTPEDYVSIIAYDDVVEVLQPAIKVENKQAIKQKIDKLYDRGSTNLTGGTLEGYTQVKANYKKDYINRVLLLSDGLANAGITDPAKIKEIVRTKNYEDGISLSTFGVGLDYNEDLMTAMAESGAGNYFFIDNPETIASVFDKELKGLLNVVAQNTKLTVTLPEGVKLEKIYGYSFAQNGRQVTVTLRDIFSEETKGVLLRLSLENNVKKDLPFTASIEYDNAVNNKHETAQLEKVLQPETDKAACLSYFNESVMQQIVLYKSNEDLERAMQEIDNGNYDKARKMVAQNDVYLKSNRMYVSKSKELQKMDSTNAGYLLKIKEAESLSADEKKFLQKSSKSESYKVRSKKVN
jgi:Ca-activated chloride channel homolog